MSLRHQKARNNLGMMEGQAGNHHRAFKHFVISASAGSKKSLDLVKRGYMAGYVAKEQYANTITSQFQQVPVTKSCWIYLSEGIWLGILQKSITQTHYGTTKRVKMRRRVMRGIKHGQRIMRG